MNENSVMPPAMILCGGRGTRLRDVTELLPKPMVPIGEQPILWHIMHIYAASECAASSSASGISANVSSTTS